MHSPYMMESGFTVGQNYTYMLLQLLVMKELIKEKH